MRHAQQSSSQVHMVQGSQRLDGRVFNLGLLLPRQMWSKIKRAYLFFRFYLFFYLTRSKH
jgi:hypothetical protein